MRSHVGNSRVRFDRALGQWLFGQSALTLAAGVLLVLYYLVARGREWSSLSQMAVGMAILTAAPALLAVLLGWRRRANG